MLIEGYCKFIVIIIILIIYIDIKTNLSCNSLLTVAAKVQKSFTISFLPELP